VGLPVNSSQSSRHTVIVQSSPFFVHVTYGCDSVLFYWHSDMLCISGFMDVAIFAQKLDVTSRLRQWGSYAALGLACRNIRCRQRMLGTTSCSRGLIGHRCAQVATVGRSVWSTHRVTSNVISMPAGFRRHFVGKTLRNVRHCDLAEVRFVGNLVITWTFS